MKYDSIASFIDNKVNNIEGTISKLKSISFDSIWSGGSYQSLTTSINTKIDEVETGIKNIKQYAQALFKLQEYKSVQKEIANLQAALASLPEGEEYDGQRASLQQQISALTENLRVLRIFISKTLGEALIGTKYEHIYFKEYDGFVVDVNKFEELFDQRKLKKISDGVTLYDYVAKEDVQERLNEIKSIYVGRDAAVNCALGIMEIAADKGLKLDYDWGGGHNTAIPNVDYVARGVDCSGFVSWAIDQGSKETFLSRTTGSLLRVGNGIDYTEAQAGDILVFNNGSVGHVVMIVENDPEAKEFLVVEAAGSENGVLMQTRSYSSLRRGNYIARDLTELYGN